MDNYGFSVDKCMQAVDKSAEKRLKSGKKVGRKGGKVSMALWRVAGEDVLKVESFSAAKQVIRQNVDKCLKTVDKWHEMWKTSSMIKLIAHSL